MRHLHSPPQHRCRATEKCFVVSCKSGCIALHLKHCSLFGRTPKSNNTCIKIRVSGKKRANVRRNSGLFSISGNGAFSHPLVSAMASWLDTAPAPHDVGAINFPLMKLTLPCNSLSITFRRPHECPGITERRKSHVLPKRCCVIYLYNCHLISNYCKYLSASLESTLRRTFIPNEEELDITVRKPSLEVASTTLTQQLHK